MDPDPYRRTLLEEWLESMLASTGTLLAPARSILDFGYPPGPDVPIITREMLGPLSGTYERYLQASPPFPLSTIEMVRCLQGYPGVLEEDIHITHEPQVRIMAEYRNGTSVIIDARFERSLEHRALLAFTATWPERPAAASIGMLARAYPERFIASLGAVYEDLRSSDA